MNFLDTVLEVKQAEIGRRARVVPVARLKEKELYHLPRRSLEAALLAKKFGIIAEVKKASPSQGLLCTDFNPVRIARQYQWGGASAVSVLTDETFFSGRLEYLAELRSSIGLPLLRKDFIVDPYQLHEAKSAGADAVLLILALLNPGKLAELAAQAAELGLETLVEIHNEEELRTALETGARVIGVNNRDLDSLRTSLETSFRLGPTVPPDRVAISESGITSGKDLVRLHRTGYRGALIGGFLMRQKDPGGALSGLLEEFARRDP